MDVLKDGNWTYFSDRPVGLRNDLLWKGQIINEQIYQIAERVVSPLFSSSSSQYSDDTSSSITFAIYGRWGMGKSSALRMIQEASYLLTKGHVEERLHFCEYPAPSYEMLPYDARTTMVLRMLTSLAGGPKQAIDQFLGDALAVGKLEDTLPPGRDDGGTSRMSYILSRMSITLSSLVDFDKILANRLRNKEGENHALVVLIDDLDRCKTDFIWQVLDSIQQLSNIPNLFFVLAVDQERLRRTVEERFERTGGATDPDFALEKYIQHAVTVPDLDENGLKILVEKLLEDYREKDIVANAIVENIQFLQNGLHVLTPRSIKRCLNTIRPDLRRRLIGGASSEEQQMIVKERMLEYVWPDFYHQYFLPMKHEDVEAMQSKMAFKALEITCLEFTKDDIEQLRFSLKRISERFDVDWEVSVKEDLALYLGLPPYWFAEENPEGKKKARLIDILRGMPDLSHMQKSKEEGILTYDSEKELEGEFYKLYFGAEAAEKANKNRELIDLLVKFYNLVAHNRSHFSSNVAYIVGNMAINAENAEENDLAIKLYELALELDPTHSNNMQNFVQFILDEEIVSHYHVAEDLIEQLKTGKHINHRPERTMSLDVRLMALIRKVGEDIDLSTVNKMVEKFIEEPQINEFTSIVSILGIVQDYTSMRLIAKTLYPITHGEIEKYTIIRTLADRLAATPTIHQEAKHNEFEAMEIYRYLLRNPFHIEDLELDRPTIQYNYALTLNLNNYYEEAGRMFFEAYKGGLKDINLRRAFGTYLLNAGRPELASLVSEGEPLEDMVLRPNQQSLPERFLDMDAELWWEV